jgi:toxin CcdB
MAQFDVHRMASGALVVDCQSVSLAFLTTRVVAPLMPATRVPARKDRLHPVFEVEGQPHLLAVHLAATLPARDLGPVILSLAQEHHAIVGAFDRLLTGV